MVSSNWPLICVWNLYRIWKVVGSCDLAYVLAISWHWASLANPIAFIFESALIRTPTTSKLAILLSILDTSKVVPPHPFKTFCPSTDFSDFEADVIHPAICAACSQAELSQAPDPECPVFSVSHPSLEETLQFLLDIDYNHPGHKLYLPPPLPTPRLSATIPLTHTTSVVGYVSNKHPNCYVWQSGYFEEGSHVGLHHNCLCFVKLCQLSASFIPCSPLAIPASSVISIF